MLQITDFKKSYHGIPALEIPYLLIPKGIHWIKGSNGAGKTTLFRSIAGMIPFKGQILLEKLILPRMHFIQQNESNFIYLVEKTMKEAMRR